MSIATWTPIALPNDDTAAAGDLLPGACITTMHPATMRIGTYRVHRTRRRLADDCMGVQMYDGRLLIGADDHQLWVPGTGWTPLRDLWTGTRLAGERPGMVELVWTAEAQRLVDLHVHEAASCLVMGLLSHAGAPV